MNLRHGRGPRVVIALHPLPCAACAAYAGKLCAAVAATKESGAVVHVVLPVSSDTPSGEHDMPIACDGAVLRDPGGAFASGLPHVAVIDQWGEVFSAADAGDGHSFPDVEEIVDWLHFVSIQCPECEGPEGEWRTL